MSKQHCVDRVVVCAPTIWLIKQSSGLAVNAQQLAVSPLIGGRGSAAPIGRLDEHAHGANVIARPSLAATASQTASQLLLSAVRVNQYQRRKDSTRKSNAPAQTISETVARPHVTNAPLVANVTSDNRVYLQSATTTARPAYDQIPRPFLYDDDDNDNDNEDEDNSIEDAHLTDFNVRSAVISFRDKRK